MTRFQNKTIVITGGSEGIGLATAQRFLAEGANVVIAGRSQSALTAASDKLVGGEKLLTVLTDISKVADLKVLFKKTHEVFGEIHSIFANEESGAETVLGETEEAAFENLINNNFKSAYFSIQEALPYMANGGSITMRSSLTRYQGNPGFAVYAATKAAVSQLIRSMTATLLPTRGIRVNAVSPGIIDDEMMDGELHGEMRKKIEEQTPAGRLGCADEVAGVVTFLASDDARFISAQDILVDGGRINTNLWTFD